jgi:hypothetical protein
VFKVPGSPSYIPGDINDDGVLDLNDLTSYTNYTGLRQGDADFDGYIRKGDTNNNGLIDAFDISQVTTRIEGGVSIQPDEPELQGQLEASVSETELQAGDTLEITVTGKDLAGVNALSFALPYNPQDLRFDALEATGMAEMEDLSKDRRHSNGGQAFYATFVNLGNQPTLEGNDVRMVIRFTVQRTHRFTLDIRDAVLVSKDLKTLQPLP